MAEPLNSPTQSGSNGQRPRNRVALVSFVVGVLAVLTIPIGVYITDQRNDLRLIHAGFAVPVGFLLGVVAIRLARRARRRLERTLGRAGGQSTARLGRILTNDPGIGVARHADAGYEDAIGTAHAHGLRLPMEE